jgi:SAM-dependent methyltransferase
VGCGTGVWLSVAKELEIVDITGVDGDYVDRKSLAIPSQNFLAKDLKLPFNLNRKFDLVISSEVAEHLPLEVAEEFIDTLICHSDFVLFSAAAPGQGGTYHINEQPQQFWVEKFVTKGYLPIDLLRDSIWVAKGVDWWYKQNMILFVKEEVLKSNSNLQSLYEAFRKDNYNKIHPEMVYYQKGITSSIGRFLEEPVYSVRKFMTYILS